MEQGLRTVYLGQFEHANAERIAEALEEAGIAWTSKSFGRLTRLLFAGDWGVRMFVDSRRVDEARQVAGRVVGKEGE